MSMCKILLYTKLPQYLNIYFPQCCLLYSPVDFFTFFNRSDGGFDWSGLSIAVFTNIMNNSNQVKDTELQTCFLFLNHTRNAFFSSFGITWITFLRKHLRKLSLRKSLLKICKTASEKGSETVRVERLYLNTLKMHVLTVIPALLFCWNEKEPVSIVQ